MFMTRNSFIALVATSLIMTTSAFAAVAKKHESWSGTIKSLPDGKNAVLVVGTTEYQLEGKQEAALLKDNGQKVTISGKMSKDTIEISSYSITKTAKAKTNTAAAAPKSANKKL